MRHIRAKDIHIAGNNDRRVHSFRRAAHLRMKFGHLICPLRIGRVPCVDDYIDAVRRLHRIIAFAIKSPDGPPRLGKRLRRMSAKAPRLSKNKHCLGHITLRFIDV